MAVAVLGLGGNLGARRALLTCARALLAEQPGLRVLASSPLFHTPPLGPPQPEYLNAALKIEWLGSARALLTVTQHIEQLLQRQRGARWGARTLDIDILHWSEGEVRERGLVVPHPELETRLFALVPLLVVAPELAARFGALSPAARGFAPAEPFEATIRERAGTARTPVYGEAEELLSAFVEALGALAGPLPPARATLPFAGISPDPGDHGRSLPRVLQRLEQQVRACFRHGFAVRRAAITHVGEGRFRGVFVGAHCGASRSLAPVRIQLSEHARGGCVEIART